MNKAVIYCRVSTKRQTKVGDGLASQATRCSEFAKYRQLKVVNVFEDSKSGSLIDRPGMQAMLKYLRKHRKENITVLIDDISRLARGINAHTQLRAAITKTGAELASPSLEFGEDSDSVMVEYMLATVSQHHRQKNAEQTHNRRRARMLGGYWVHFAPRGYKYTDGEGGGRVLIRDEPLASIIAEGLEGYASKRFVLKAELMRFWQGFAEFPKNSKGMVANEEVNRILNRVVYAGYIQSDIMEISLRPAKHEPLISLETWQKIQDRMQDKAYVPARKNLSEEFPLRGACRCAECENPLTACWSKGRTKRYPYYYCVTKGCEARSKMIRRDVLEGEFEAMLKELQPSKAIFKTISTLAKKWWSYRHEQEQYFLASLKKEQVKLNTQMEQVMDRKGLAKDTYPIKINSLNSFPSIIMGASNEKSNTSTMARVI